MMAAAHTVPDLSFPYLTTDSSRTGRTSEYRAETTRGYTSRDDLSTLHPDVETGTSTPRDGQTETELKAKKKIVTWTEHDPEHPWNWGATYRWYLTGVASVAVMQVAMCSAIVTGDFLGQQVHFDVSSVVIALTVTLTVCGFGVGPLLWSPLSELVGRRALWIIPFFIYILFNIPCALAPNIGCLLVSRFLCGFFGSAPLTLAGGTIADIWGPTERGFAIAIFAAAPYTGPVIGPLVGGFIGESIGWRWLYWVNMISAGVVWLFVLTIPETFSPYLLKRRAQKLCVSSGTDSYVTEQQLYPRPLRDIIVETLVRPFEMLATEPILLLMSLYIALVYGLLYSFFSAFPVVFDIGYGWSKGRTGLTFCSVFIGVALALLATPILERRYVAKGAHATPEDRLPGMLIGGPFVPVSLLIFGWTAPPYVQPSGASWLGPTSAGIPFGFGMVLVYFSANAYLIEAFPDHVASALAAKTVVRSAAGAVVPLFITQMYLGMGNGGAASLLAGVAVVMAAIPFAFRRWGADIRGKSRRAAR